MEKSIEKGNGVPAGAATTRSPMALMGLSSRNGNEEEEMNTSMRTTETKLRLVPMALGVAALVVMLKNSQSSLARFPTRIMELSGSYLLFPSFSCYSSQASSSTMPRAWTFFLLEQILTYVILAAAAVSSEVLYLANKGDSAITWSAACGSFAGFCHKATTSVIITFVTVLCYAALSLVSSYRLFTKFDAPVNYISKKIETTVFHG
ncbi:CASP-like protein F16 [Hibiscus syriacus]|uniref:CASP-like protein n=1 Tax=Hibiscus syriacus TaxID=106335 RepID=A0A6A2YPC2_HIBSY|nr:CASP-like protein F16 [Hibiscus syriacus]